MNVNEILIHLESLFAKQDIQAVEPYLTDQLDKAYDCQDYNTCITILNELIGFFRDYNNCLSFLYFRDCKKIDSGIFRDFLYFDTIRGELLLPYYNVFFLH